MKYFKLQFPWLLLCLAACASDPIDPLDPEKNTKTNLQPQCPIGYEPVLSTEIVVKSKDENTKTGSTKQVVKCEPER